MASMVLRSVAFVLCAAFVLAAPKTEITDWTIGDSFHPFVAKLKNIDVTATMYDQENYAGDKIEFRHNCNVTDPGILNTVHAAIVGKMENCVPACVNLPDSWRDRVMSVQTFDTDYVFRVYEAADCQGTFNLISDGGLLKAYECGQKLYPKQDESFGTWAGIKEYCHHDLRHKVRSYRLNRKHTAHETFQNALQGSFKVPAPRI